MKKIKAYTLIEVAVAMLLAGICISICYTAYGIIDNYYQSFQQKNQATDQVLSLKHVLEKDFLQSKAVLKNGEGIKLNQDSVTINYLFEQQYILREINELHTDTFKIASQNLQLSFEGAEVQEDGLVDEIKFTAILAKGIVVPLQVNKRYSSENLFK